MHFFGLMGFLSFLLGIGIMGYLSVSKIFFSQYQIANRPLFFLGLLAIIFGTQLFLTGFLAELVSRNAAERNNYHIEKQI